MFHVFWGLPHKRGVCILDIFYRINHFVNPNWRVKYLALFAVGAAALGLVDANKTLAIFFFSAFLAFPPNFCQTRL